MKRITSFLIIALAGISFAHAAGDPEAGKAKAAVCGSCHGADGNSAAPNFPKLAGQGAAYTIKQLQDMKDGKRVVNEMVGFLPALDEQGIKDIAAYYESQATTLGQADPDLVELGQKLYMGGNMETSVTACAGCHSPTGKGNGPAAFPALSGQHPAYIVAQLQKFREGARHEGAAVADVRVNDANRMMRDIAFKLKDFEIEALASYISGLH